MENKKYQSLAKGAERGVVYPNHKRPTTFQVHKGK